MLTNKIRQHRGAVSIFLLIILLPSLTMAGVFIDVARAHLAQEVVSSSADLALNTVLTDYDKDLKDYYGLIASCQSSDEIIKVSKQYFIDSMKSQGVTTDEATVFVDNVLDAFLGDDDISDMLRITEGADVQITRTPNGAMSNPAIIKEGISEFMKYRSPVNGVADLFKKITESGAAEKLEAVTDEAKMIEAREAFYQAEKALIKQAETTYKAIKKYEEKKSHTGVLIASEDFINKLSGFLMDPLKHGPKASSNTNQLQVTTEADFKEIYKNAHELMVKNLFNTHATTATLPSTLMNTQSINYQGPNSTYSEEYTASATDIARLLRNLGSALETYQSKKNAMDSAWNNTGSMAAGDYHIQYWVKVGKNCSSAYSNYKSAAEALWRAANAVENAVEYPEEGAFTEKIGYFSNSVVTMPTPDSSNMIYLADAYYNVMNGYYSIQSEVTGGCSSFRNVTNAINGVSRYKSLTNVSTVAHIYNIANDVTNFVKDAEAASELLKTAKAETDKLPDLIDKYVAAFKKWKTAATLPSLDNNELAKQDRKLITDLENGGMLTMTKASVTELSTRLGNVKTLFDTLAKDMKGIKYNGKPIMDIKDYATFRGACKASEGSIPVNESQLNKYAGDLFSFEIGEAIQRIEVHEGKTSTKLDAGGYYVITDSFHPLLTKTSMELYTWLNEKFGAPKGGTTANKAMTGFDVNDEKTAESADGVFNNKGKETASAVDTSESTKGKNFSEWKGAGLPSKDKHAPEKKSLTDKIGDAANFASEIFSNFGETFMASLENIRDDLYAEDYIFSMFTHDTFEKEGYYSKLSKEHQDKITATTTSTYYTDAIKKEWTGSDEVKTLTLNERSAQLNWCYGGEIEYILYGNNLNALNKTTAYANVYLIRYALDLAPVFQFYWNDTALNAVAVAINAFFYIPVDLTKTLACLAITLGEAAADIATLKQGIPVLLYKVKEQDLVCNYQNIFNGKTPNPGSRDGITLQYSDYLKMFLFIKLTSDENQIYLRTGDVIQANMTLAAKNDKFALSKSQVFFTMSGSASIEPMWSRLLAIDNLGDMTTSNGWRTMQFSMVRGY